jgi:hypothetical protein
MNRLRAAIGGLIAAFLMAPVGAEPYLPIDHTHLRRLLHKGDVILVEGSLRISSAVKYLTQSTWSHAALYIGEGACIEADVVDGVRRIRLNQLSPGHLRICRPISLTPEDTETVLAYATSRLGAQYDLKHIFDLARYLVPLPLPRGWRRRAIALGSGDPSRAICSTLIAESFHAAGYPILPEVSGESPVAAEIYHIHNTGLFVPRDFDLSPFFHVIKPDMPRPFDHHRIIWEE